MVSQEKTKSAQCYDTLKQAIVTMEIPPGERLRAKEWAEKLKSSVIPVREAIARLEEEGLLEIIPYSGARVTEIDLSMIPEIFHFTEGFNALAARLACLRLTKEEVEELQALVDQMDKDIEDPERWGVSNGAFHGLITERCHMSMSRKADTQFGGHWVRIAHTYCQDVSKQFYKQAHIDHQLIVNAIRDKEADHAEYLMRRHVKRVHNACYKAFEKAGVLDQILDPRLPGLMEEEENSSLRSNAALPTLMSLG